MAKILVSGIMVSEKSLVLKLSFNIWSWEYKTDDPHTEECQKEGVSGENKVISFLYDVM